MLLFNAYSYAISAPYNNYYVEDDKTTQPLLYMEISSNDAFTCQNINIFEQDSFTISSIEPEYNYISNSAEIEFLNTNYKFYSGQKIYKIPKTYINYDDLKSSAKYILKWYMLKGLKCLVKDIKATLLLKDGNNIQEFKEIWDNNFGKIYSYTIDRILIDKKQIKCHAVPDDMKHPAFNNFYMKRYRTALLMWDEITRQYKEVKNTQLLESDKYFKCVINEKDHNIKETLFKIIVNEQFSIGRILAVLFVIFIALSIIILMICRKIKKMREQSKSQLSQSISSSSKSSMSSTMSSTSNTSTITTQETNVPILKPKSVNSKPKNVEKKFDAKVSSEKPKIVYQKPKIVGKVVDVKVIPQQPKQIEKKVVAKIVYQTPKKVEKKFDAKFVNGNIFAKGINDPKKVAVNKK